MDFSKIRTRFAPSPTGYMHVGNLRTALYAYLICKKDNGNFLLRIEDTDQGRLVDGALDIIYDTLNDTGLVWDEGPDVGGDVGPYIQSERKNIYLDYAKKLIDAGDAYYCFCDKNRLDEMKVIQKASGMTPKYDGCCKKLTQKEVEEKMQQGIPCVVRQMIPEKGETTFEDEIYGNITTPNSTLDDNVLLKADGFPTYNFANVIDDHLMGITHVIRGSEYLSSTPKYNLLYNAFGFDIPKYIHCPPVMKDENNKLSKRNGDASYQDLVEKGFLKEAILNYIALLGWSPKGEKEIFSLDELKKEFSINGMSKSSAIFDIKKLRYINAKYIKNMTLDNFNKIALPFIRETVKREDVDFNLISKMLQVRTEVLDEIPEQVDFVDTLPDYSTDLYIHKKMKTDEKTSLEVIEKLLVKFENVDEDNFNVDNIHDEVMETVKELNVKNGYVFWPLRVATSGKAFTPGGGVEIAAIIGKKDTLNRMYIALDKLKQV
ncbi:MAG: glutamate--tRNA ligase [Oscillospiraceae bacterium]